MTVWFGVRPPLQRNADTCVQGAQSCIYRRRYIRVDESGGFQVREVR